MTGTSAPTAHVAKGTPFAALNGRAQARIDARAKGPSTAVNLDNIMDAGLLTMEVSVADLKSPKRACKIVRPRQTLMHFLRGTTALSLPQIGKAFGNRDHTTVMHGVAKITELLAVEPEDGPIETWLKALYKHYGLPVPKLKDPAK